ncbi:MAG: DUF4203 domain-containing protein [Eubacteriales bacterium]
MNTDLLFVWLFILAQVGIALVYCFWGYRYFRLVMTLYVFIFVYPLVYSALTGFTSMSQPIAILISVVLALLAGLITWKIYKLAVFLCGGIAGVLIAWGLYQSLGSSYMALCVILGIVLFILLGCIALKFQKAVVIFISSLTGAFNLVTYGLFLIMNASVVGTFTMTNMNAITTTINGSYQPLPLWVVPSVIVAIAGILVQALKTAKKVD